MPRPSLEPHLHRRSNRMLAIVLLALGAIVGAGLVGYELLKRPGDVHNQEAIERFEPQRQPPPPKKTARRRTGNWPMFALTPARTRSRAIQGVRPPFHKVWRYTNRPLLEFPPIYVNGRL